MASLATKEPAIISGVATGTGLIVLMEPLNDLFLEFGASERLAAALVKIFIFIIPVLAAWWTRSRTVSGERHDEIVTTALDSSTREELNRNLAIKAAEK